MKKTSVSALLGIQYPILQGGMAHISDAVLAAAVSNGGGLGIISAASGDIEKIAAEIDKARTLTDKPFGVNLMLMGENLDAIARLLAEKKVAVVTTGICGRKRVYGLCPWSLPLPLPSSVPARAQMR